MTSRYKREVVWEQKCSAISAIGGTRLTPARPRRSTTPKEKSDRMLKKYWKNLDLPCADILEVTLCIHAKVCSGAL
jgi:hypothetical protein